MKIFRRILIILFNLMMIFAIIRFNYRGGIDGLTMVAATFLAIGFIVIYNLYGWLVYALFAQIKKQHLLVEAGFFLLMLLPFFFVWRLMTNH
jgi:hypothetical protein